MGFFPREAFLTTFHLRITDSLHAIIVFQATTGETGGGKPR
jgi:hypothetical protein